MLINFFIFSYLTATGVSSPLKDALLARFPHVRAAFNQTAFIESLNLPHQVLADIWLPVGFPPVSFEPLNEEEEKVAQTGQFANANVRSRNNPNYNQNATGTSPNEFRSNRGHNPNANARQQGNRSRGSSFASNAASASNPRGTRQEFSDRQGGVYQQQHHHHHQHHSYSHDNTNDDVIEDPDNLWATPSSDAIGSSDFGTFDENGMFRTSAIPSSLDGGLEDFTSPAAATAFESFMQTRPHHAAQIPAQPAVNPAVPAAPAVAIPHITPDTQWLYRDPSGQIQGPFPSYRMLEWYNGKYFPENLPLRREQDAFFEPLSTWKTKCAGQIPFSAYTKETEKPVEPVSPFKRTENIPISQWFTAEPAKAEIVQVPAAKPAVPSSNPPAAAAAVAATVAVAPTNTTRSVPLESLFGVKSQPVMEKPSSPEVMMPGAASGWKKLEKPSITAKFGQLDINQPETEASIINASKPVESKAAPAPVPTAPAVTEHVVTAEPVRPAALATSSWSNSSASNASLKKISLSEILKSSEEPTIVLEKEKPASAPVPEPAIIAAGSAGWAKLSASPVQSLSSIQAEEAVRQRAVNPSGSSAASSSASKSFADLVRSAGVITSGDIAVSPVSDRAPIFKERPSQAVPSVPAAKPVAVKPSAPAVPVTTTASASPAVSSPKHASVEDWCLTSLKQSSLSKSIDPQTCTILLMDLPNPTAILTFTLETLKPMETQGNFDLAAFAQELSNKKFGPKATEKVQWSKLKSVPQVKKQEESFEVVKRKK